MASPNSNRPYSMPPTNIEGENDYDEIDRGLFLSRDDDPKYLRVIQADWKSYGPSNSPGILRFRLGQYATKPTTDAQYANYTVLKAHGSDEWFDVATSGPTHSAVLVEYWAKFIYYNYYVLQAPSAIQSVLQDTVLVNDIKGVGDTFTKALVPSIKNIAVQSMYGLAPGKPLGLVALSAAVTPAVGSAKTIDLIPALTDFKRFDPVIASSKLM